MRNMRSRRRIDSSSIFAHPVNSDHTGTLGEIVKMLYQELDIYMYIYMTLLIMLIIDMDFLYQFNLGLIAPLHSFFYEMFEKNVFQNFQKLAGLRLVGEVDNHVAIHGSKMTEVFSAFQRRSCYMVYFSWIRQNNTRRNNQNVTLIEISHWWLHMALIMSLMSYILAIIWTKAGISPIGPLETNFSEILIEIHTFAFKKIQLKCRLETGGHFVSASITCNTF